MTEKFDDVTEAQVESFLQDERGILDVNYKEVLKNFEIEGDSFISIQKCFKKIKYSVLYRRSCARDSVIAMKLLAKFALIFPSLAFTTARGYEMITNSVGEGTRNMVTELFIKHNLRFKIFRDHGDAGVEVIDRKHAELFYCQLISTIEMAPMISSSEVDFKDMLMIFEALTTFCYLGDGNLGFLTRQIPVSINEEYGIGAFENSHLKPLIIVLQILSLSQENSSSFDYRILTKRKAFILAKLDIGQSSKKVFLRPDVTILTADDVPLIPIEFKTYNCEKQFLKLSETSFDGKGRNDLLNQITLYMLFTETEIGLLCDGYNIAKVQFDFNNKIEKRINKEGNLILALPIKIHISTIKENEGPSTMMKLALLITEIIRRNRSSCEQAITKSKIKSYRSIILKDSQEIRQVLKENAEKFVFLESLKQSADFTFDEGQYLENDYEEIQVGFEFNSQALGFTLGQVETILKRRMGIAVEAGAEAKVVWKIYDPIRRLFTEDQEKLEEYNILESIQKSKEAELEIYHKIQSFNESSEKKINMPIIFGDGNIKLDCGSDFFAGGYIVMERLFGKPTKPEHFLKAREQLDLLHRNGIYHGDIKISNTFFHKNQFYFIDFGFSYLSRKSNYNSHGPDQRASADLDALGTLEKEVLGV